MKINILIIDDHKLVRDSWAFVLNSDTRFQVVGEAGEAEEGIELARKLRPDIVLMDINMSPMNGFEATKSVRKYAPGSKIVGISMHPMPAYARKMLQAGAMGYVTKNSPIDELLKAILEVYEGKKYICEEVKNILAHTELEQETDAPDLNALSKREIEIVKLIRDGNSSREIAQQLDISLKTVEVHRYNILKKLHLKNTAALVNFSNTQAL